MTWWRRRREAREAAEAAEHRRLVERGFEIARQIEPLSPEQRQSWVYAAPMEDVLALGWANVAVEAAREQRWRESWATLQRWGVA